MTRFDLLEYKSQASGFYPRMLPLSLFLFTVITRIPFTSKFLYHLDSVQFALALEKYDITVHQPHPPGYFLYVMMGRLLNYLINDANATFVSLSILFSGLTVVAIYYLGREIFDEKTGLLASAIAITSPSLWFHGEVALSYIVEAFFSTVTAFFCWKIYKGEHRYIWLAAIALGIAGGVRQNTIVFLFPLWLFSAKGAPVKKIILAAGLLGLVCLSWFVPMIWMTEGLAAYRDAFHELWLFSTGHSSVFEGGWPMFKLYSSTIFNFTVYGIGAGIFALSLAAYSLMRHKGLKFLDRAKVSFFALWILPSVIFYLLIFIHPANPGYVLIFLPAFFILIAAATKYMSDEFKRITKKEFLLPITLVLIIINVFIFFSSRYPVSYKVIRNHDKYLAALFGSIKGFNPSKTAIIVRPYVFFSYRLFMYYLPEYRVYQEDINIAPTGEIRKTFWGMNRKTYLSDEIMLPEHIEDFVTVLISGDKKMADEIKGITIKKIPPDFYVASGSVELIRKVFPGLRVQFQENKTK